jgi:CheY-like chemotaxis protein
MAVTQAVSMLGRTLGEDVKVECVLGERLWPALVDASQLEEALLNLAVNARDAMPDGGTLVIETANAHLDDDYAAHNVGVAPGDYASVVVTDSGAGMPPQVVERVFEPFLTTKEVGKGTGLGLSMVYGFVKQSAGHIKIYSEVGHGTSVKLYFPKADRQIGLGAATRNSNDDLLPSGTETILVVEDEPSVRRMAVSALAGLGYKVREASDGKSALDILRDDPTIDLLFTDMVMPNGMNGQELAGLARIDKPDLRVLLTSGYSELFLARRQRFDTDLPLLSKPYRRDNLAKAVRRALGDPSTVGIVEEIGVTS